MCIRDRIVVGAASHKVLPLFHSSLAHVSKASYSAEVPRHVPFLPIRVQPAKARLFIWSRAGGVCISSKEVHLRKASRSMRLSVLANLRCCSWEQRAKVPPRISLISVREMSTVCSLSQCSKAAGPIQQKSAGRVSISSPASEKQPSGMTRFGSRGSYSVLSKLIVCKVRHFSKARVWRRACGAS